MPPKDKVARKIYNQKYFHDHKTVIMRKRKSSLEEKYQCFSGHQQMIYGAIKRFAAEKGIEISPYKEFRNFSLNCPHYQELYRTWADSCFDDDFAPVVSRRVFTTGYLVGNLYWGRKREFGIAKGQKQAKNNLCAVVTAIEHSQAERAQAVPSPEQAAQDLAERQTIRRRKELREAAWHELRKNPKETT